MVNRKWCKGRTRRPAATSRPELDSRASDDSPQHFYSSPFTIHGLRFTVMQGITTTRLGDIYVRREADIVKVRERVRRLAREMGFDSTTQIKITTAVSELTRNIYEYARAGAITLSLATRGAAAAGLQITARDDGPGIDEAKLRSIVRGTYRSPSGLGVGLIGTRRLMDEFDIQSKEGEGTRVSVVKWLPPAEAEAVRARADFLRDFVNTEEDDSALEELSRQNRDLVQVLGELEEKREQLERLNTQARRVEPRAERGQRAAARGLRDEGGVPRAHHARPALAPDGHQRRHQLLHLGPPRRHHARAEEHGRDDGAQHAEPHRARQRPARRLQARIGHDAPRPRDHRAARAHRRAARADAAARRREGDRARRGRARRAAARCAPTAPSSAASSSTSSRTP